MTSHIADAALRRVTASCRGQRRPHLAADSHIELSASRVLVTIRERPRTALTRAHAIDLEA